MSERDYRDYLDDIINSVKYIKEFTDNISFESFRNDIKTQYAVIRCFEVMGEASKRIPDDYKEKYPLIPWRVMAGMRDRLIHGYDVVDVTILWRTIRTDLPSLEKSLKGLK